MNYLSLFSGIGGFDLGFDRAGMNCIGQCEIDPHASAVLRRHWPDVKRIKDVRKITKTTFDVRPDLICGGFPCQDLSVAGKRRGLAGGRSGLWHEYRRIVGELEPQWVVVENVPGLFSSNGGRDFAVLIRGLEKLGYMGTWKTFDSRYFGVAQRRRRVFVIASLGGRGLAEILLESEGVRGNSSPREKAREDVAGTLKAFPGGGGQHLDVDQAVCGYLQVTHALTSRCDSSEDGTGRGTPIVAAPLTSKMAKGTEGPSGDECQNLVCDKKPIAFSCIDDGGDATTDLAPTVRCSCHGAAPSAVCFHSKASASQSMNPSDVSPSLDTSKSDGLAVCYENHAQDSRIISYDTYNQKTLKNTSQTLRAGCGHDQLGVICNNFAVRRLMPVECERLQAFPDGWTKYATKEDGTVYEQSDTQRYRQLGNAITTAVAEWIGRRIVEIGSEK